MKVAIHQPHFFPWIGYMDKMAKVDAFVLLDEVQMEKGSQMNRNRVLDNNGEIKYITISGDTNNYLTRKYLDINTKDTQEWTARQINALKNYYRRAAGLTEIMPIIEEYLSRDYQTVCSWTVNSIHLVKNILKINTPIIMQSQIDYDRTCKKSNLVYAICNAVGANIYFSGRGGSVGYLSSDMFAKGGVSIVFQDFQHPLYTQCNSAKFVAGISVLDMFLNCGIEKSREIFWNNVRSSNEFGE